jgi:hypothetical protein
VDGSVHGDKRCRSADFTEPHGWQEEAAGAKVAFTLERSNGTVKTYYRKANADGVATFTLRFRGTYEVTASFGDYITDTVILKK